MNITFACSAEAKGNRQQRDLDEVMRSWEAGEEVVALGAVHSWVCQSEACSTAIEGEVSERSMDRWALWCGVDHWQDGFRLVEFIRREAHCIECVQFPRLCIIGSPVPNRRPAVLAGDLLGKQSRNGHKGRRDRKTCSSQDDTLPHHVVVAIHGPKPQIASGMGPPSVWNGLSGGW